MLKITGVLFILGVSGVYTPLFLDTDKLKMALHVWKVSGAFEKQAPGPGCSVDANPALKVNRSINISCLKTFFAAYVLCSLRLFKLSGPNNIRKKPHCQVKKTTTQNSY